MLKHLVEIFGCIGLIFGALGYVYLESTYDLAFSPFIHAILLGLSCLVGTLRLDHAGQLQSECLHEPHRGETTPWEDR